MRCPKPSGPQTAIAPWCQKSYRRGPGVRPYGIRRRGENRQRHRLVKDIHPLAPEHLPPYIGAADGSNPLFTVVLWLLVIILMAVGNLYLKLHATGGSLLTAWLGERLGNVRPFYASCLAMLVALALLAAVCGFWLYAAGTCMLTFAIGMGLPFAIAEIAELDKDGRFIILSVPAIGMGAMVGPGIAGALADAGSFTPVLVAAGTAIALSMILMRYSDGFRKAVV